MSTQETLLPELAEGLGAVDSKTTSNGTVGHEKNGNEDDSSCNSNVVNSATEEHNDDEPAALLEDLKRNPPAPVSVVKSLLSGQWLPLVSDKARNNVKNRWTLMAAYANAVALVLVILVLLLYEPDVQPDGLSFGIPPPTNVHLGVPMEKWTARLVNGYGVAIPEKTLRVQLVLMSSLDRVVTLTPAEKASSRKISCLDTIFNSGNQYRDEDFGLCLPDSADSEDEPFITDTIKTTDGSGTATFDNLTLAHGIPGTYLLLITLPGTKLLQYTYIEVLGTVYNVTQKTQFENANGAIPLRTSLKFTMEAHFSVPSSAPMPTRVAAQVVATNIIKGTGINGLGESTSIPSLSQHPLDDVVTVSNAFSFSTNFTNVSTLPGEAESMIKTVFEFDVFVNGTNHQDAQIGVFFWGVTVPLLFQNFANENMFPPRMNLPPKFVWTETGGVTGADNTPHYPTVKTLTLTAPSASSSMSSSGTGVSVPLQNNDTVLEGANLILTLEVIMGRPVPDGLVTIPFYLGIAPSAMNGPAMNVFEKDGTPLSYPKTWTSLDTSSPNNQQSGQASVATVGADRRTVSAQFEWQFAYTGNTGYYDVSVAMDGLDLPWSNLQEYSSMNGTNTREIYLPLTLNVDTAVAKSTLEFNSAPWVNGTEVTVGESWIEVPVITVFQKIDASAVAKEAAAAISDTSNFAPLPGKWLRMKTREDDSKIGIDIKSQAGNAEGKIHPFAIKVLYVTEEGDYHFDLYVDRVLIGTIIKSVRWPAHNPSYCVPWITEGPPKIPLNLNLEEASRYSHVVWTNFPTSWQVIARDHKGRPISEAKVTITQSAPHKRTYVKTNGNGTYTWEGKVTGISAQTPVSFGSFCTAPGEDVVAGTAPIMGWLWVPVVPRVNKVRLTNVNNANSQFSIDVDAKWFAVNDSNPVVVDSKFVWVPRYVSVWTSFLSIPLISFMGHLKLKDASMSQQTYWYPFMTHPGVYLMTVKVDGAWSGVFPMFSMEGGFYNLTLTRPYFNSNNTDFALGKPPTDNYGPLIVPNCKPGIRPNHVGLHPLLTYRSIADASQDPNTPFQDIWNDDSSSSKGAIFLGSSDDGHANFQTGIASLHTLVVNGLVEGYQYKIKYCSAVRYQMLSSAVNQSWDPEIKEVCVEEPLIFTADKFSGVPAEISLTHIGVDNLPSQNVVLAPGHFIRHVRVTISNREKRDGYIIFSAVMSAKLAAQGASITCNVGMKKYWGTSNVSSINEYTVMPMKFDAPCLVAESTPAGNYELYVIGGGYTSNPLKIQVKKAISSMNLTITAPGDSAKVSTAGNFSLNAEVPVTLQVLGASGEGVPLQPVVLQVQYDGKDSCQGTACGSLSPGSAQFAVTDSKGLARLPISFTQATTSPFWVRATAASQGSPVAIKQHLASEMSSVANKLGVSRAFLPKLIPDEKHLYGVMSSISDAPLPSNSFSSQLFSSSALKGLGSPNAVLSGSDGLAERFQDAATQVRQSDGQVNSAVHYFLLQNPVHFIKIIKSNPPVFELHADIESQTLNQLSGRYQLGEDVLEVQALGADGVTPVPNVSISFDISNSDYAALIQSSAATSTESTETTGQEVTTITVLETDENGIVNLKGTHISFTGPGTFELTVSASGGGNLVIPDAFEYKVVKLKTAVLMKYVAFIIVTCYSPLLLASVPHSRHVYGAFSILCTLGILVMTIWYASTSYDLFSSILVKYYLIFACCICGAMCFINITGLSLEMISIKKQSLRWTNDEARAAKIVRYTTWITNVRIEDQIKELDEEEDKKAEEEALKKKSTIKRKLSQIHGGASNAVELVGMNEVLDRAEQKRKRRLERPPLKMPKEVDPAVTIPVNYLIVCASTAVLGVALTLFMLFILQEIKVFFALVLSYLPNPTAEANLVAADEVLIRGLSSGLAPVVEEYPEFAFLTKMIPPIKEINLIQVLSKVRYFINELIIRLNLSFGIGITMGVLVVAATAVFTLRSVKNSIIKARRNKLVTPEQLAKLNLQPAEGYIGLHCFHFIIAHQVVTWVIILIVLILSIPDVVLTMLEKLFGIILGSIASLILEKFITLIVVGKLLTHKFTIVRPEMYAIYHFVGLILGLFTGLAKSISRWVMAIVAATGMFARLDVTIFPAPLMSMDAAHKGFLSVVISEAKQNNPIFLTFAAILLKELRLRELALTRHNESNSEKSAPALPENGDIISEEKEAGLLVNEPATSSTPSSSAPTTVACDSVEVSVQSNREGNLLTSGKYGLSASILNVSRVLMRREASPENELDLWKPAVVPDLQLSDNLYSPWRRAKQEKIKNRFWLLWILHKNPSLRKYRKHQLFIEKGQEGEICVKD